MLQKKSYALEKLVCVEFCAVTIQKVMMRRVNIFGLIFMMLVFQRRVTSANELSSTTEEVSTQKSTLPESSGSSKEVPSIFPSNGAGGKPIISSNKTVQKPNLSDIDIKRNDVTLDNSTNPTEGTGNATVKEEDTTTKGNVSILNHHQLVNPTQATTLDTNTHLYSTEAPIEVIARNSSKSVDTEVSDLLEVPKKKPDLKPVSPEITYEPNQDVNLSIVLFDKFLRTEDSMRNHSDHQMENVGIIQGKLAAILAAVFLVVSIFGYISLLSWRRFLEHRYGNREMLVNEEDFYTADLGHFSI